MQKSQQFLYQYYTFQQEQDLKAARDNLLQEKAVGIDKPKSKATHFLEYDQRTREYRPVPIPMYPRD